MFSTKQFNTIMLEAVVERFFFWLFCTKCRCMVLDSFSYWHWPAALPAINPSPKQKRSCKIRSPLCRQGGSCLVLFFSLSLSSSVFSSSLQLSAHISLSQEETGLEAIAGDPLLLGRLLSSQISHVLAFKCWRFAPDFPELCPEVWRVHQTGIEKVFLSIPSSQLLLKTLFSFHRLPNQVTACKIATDFTGLKSRGDGMLAERAWHK